MGFIPIFLTLGGACLLFFLTVRNSMQKKLNRHLELRQELKEIEKLKDLVIQSETVEAFLKKIKTEAKSLNLDSSAKDKIRDLKVNRVQFNQLIAKAPYNWVAKISGFQPIN